MENAKLLLDRIQAGIYYINISNTYIREYLKGGKTMLELKEKFQALSEAIFDGDDETSLDEVDKLLREGTNPLNIFTECVEPTLNDMGEQFAALEIFLPDLVLAGDVVTAIQDKLMLPAGHAGKTRVLGNAAAAGAAKILLNAEDAEKVRTLSKKMECKELSADRYFMKRFIECINF